MLPFDFDYFKPATLNEAVNLFQTLDRHGKQPMFFSGGTELITLGRIDLNFTDAVIDIKDIPECKAMGVNGDFLVIGSALSLTKIEEENAFPLLTKTLSEVADHTVRGKVTLGGNICAQIFYREAVLPFLLADSQVVIAGPNGIRAEPIHRIFNEYLRIEKGEILIQLVTDNRFIEAPFVSIKRRQQWNTGYPLITIAALKIDDEIRVALSGLCPFPFRSREIEIILNNRSLSLDERIKRVMEVLPSPILDDVEGSANYRLFVLENLLSDILTTMYGEV